MSDEEIERLHTEASELARRSGDPRLTVLVALAHRYIAVSFRHELLAAVSDVEEALATAEKLGARALQLGAWVILTPLRWFYGSLERSLDASDRALALFEELGDRPPGAPWWIHRPSVHALRASVLLELGRLAESRTELEKALRVSEDRGDLTTISISNRSIGLLAETLGDLGLGRASSARALDAAAQSGSILALIIAEHSWGTVSLLAGDAREAADALTRALEMIRNSGAAGYVESQVLASLAHAHALLGDPVAREESLAAVRLAQWSMSPPRAYLDRARVLRILDGLAARSEIEAALLEAERLAVERGYRMSLPFVHEERAELARLLGDETVHQRELREAQRLFAEIDAPLQVERLARELRA
jgi:tetratricopeptide (TPR) repeat protein